MTESEFFAAIGRISREQEWQMDNVALLAIGFIAENKTRREQFVRSLKRLQREERGE